MVITKYVMPPFTYPNVSLYSRRVIIVLCDLQIFLCPMNDGATHVPCATLPDTRTSGALMPYTTALLRLGAFSAGVALIQPSPCVRDPSPDPA
jgi:hypothetical protein